MAISKVGLELETVPGGKFAVLGGIFQHYFHKGIKEKIETSNFIQNENFRIALSWIVLFLVVADHKGWAVQTLYL